ncbi:hypothetical protein [Wenyingzhuangia sp. IMCC45574]
MNIAIVEINDWHAECVVSHVKNLKKSSCNLTVICHRKLKESLKSISNDCAIIYLDFGKTKSEINSKFELWKFLYKQKFDKIVFNTAEKKAWKIILPPYPKKTELIGCVHNLHRFKTHTTQKLIGKKLDKVLVLGDYLLKNLPPKIKTKAHTFYSIYYPESNYTLKKPANEIWIVVPGTVDSKRRDYKALTQVDLPVNSPIKIILLGNSTSPKEQEIVAVLKQKSWCITFDDYVNDDLFNAYIKNCDYLLTLIHPNISFYQEYLATKLSGSYNIAWSFDKTLLMEEQFKNTEIVNKNAIFYKLNSLNNTLEHLENKKGTFGLSKKNIVKEYLIFIYS